LQNNGEVITGVQRWTQEPLKTLVETGIKKLPESWHNCIAVSGENIEK
jgi:hypothetical protein